MEKKTRDKLKQAQKVVEGLRKKGVFGKKLYVWSGLDKIGMNLFK